MPCYTRFQWAEQVRIENHPLFIEALKAQDDLTYRQGGSIISFRGVIRENKHEWQVDGYFDTTTGQLTTRNADEANAIRRLYARKVVSNAARRYGWTEQNQNDGTIKLKRRS